MSVLNLVVHQEFVELKRAYAHETLASIGKLQECGCDVKHIPWWDDAPLESIIALKAAPAMAKGYDLVMLYGARRTFCLKEDSENLQCCGIPVAYDIQGTVD